MIKKIKLPVKSFCLQKLAIQRAILSKALLLSVFEIAMQDITAPSLTNFLIRWLTNSSVSKNLKKIKVSVFSIFCKNNLLGEFREHDA